MKLIATIFNLILLGCAIILTIKEGIPRKAEGPFILFFFILFYITPVISIVTIFRSWNTNTWLSLYFQRKAAEERKRIAEIEQDKGNKNAK